MKNLSQIEGNLGQNPTHTVLSSGKEVTRFNVAVNKSWMKGKEKKTVTDWFRIEAWGHLALPASRLNKGDAVFLQGELRTGSYTKDDITYSTTHLVVINLRKLDYSIFAKAEAPEAISPETEELEPEELPV